MKTYCIEGRGFTINIEKYNGDTTIDIDVETYDCYGSVSNIVTLTVEETRILHEKLTEYLDDNQ